MNDDELIESPADRAIASDILKKSRRLAYATDKWMTPLYFDLASGRIQLDPTHRATIIQSVRDCGYKLLALKYHVDNIGRLEKEFTEEDLKFMGQTESASLETISTPVNYELDAFLLQARACLEVFCQIVASSCRLSRVTPKSLANVLSKRSEKFATPISQQIKSHSFVWRILQGERNGSISPRDWIAHYGATILTSFRTEKRETGLHQHGPMISTDMPMPASLFAKFLLRDLELFVKESLAVVFERSPPTREQFLITARDLQ